MDRKGIACRLSKLTEIMVSGNYDPRRYWAREVTFGYGTADAVRADYMEFRPVNNSVSGIEKGDFCCYEIKSCMDDYESGHGLNCMGDYNYLVCTEDLYRTLSESGNLPRAMGVYIPSPDWDTLVCARKARRKDRQIPVSVMLLRMFRSASRDICRKESDSL